MMHSTTAASTTIIWIRKEKVNSQSFIGSRICNNATGSLVYGSALAPINSKNISKHRLDSAMSDK